MVFITPCWKKSLRFETLHLSGVQCAKWVCALLITGLSWLSPGSAYAETPVELQALKLERQDTALSMSANWQFDLPTALEDALLKGITLYFVTEVDVAQERWYVYNQRVAYAERHVRVFYQPLTRRWRVNISSQPFNATSLGMSLGHSYDTAEEAMSAVRHIVQWRIANASDYNPETKQTITINFKLDLKQLPRPLQIGAVGQSDWHISYTKSQRLELTP